MNFTDIMGPRAICLAAIAAITAGHLPAYPVTSPMVGSVGEYTSERDFNDLPPLAKERGRVIFVRGNPFNFTRLDIKTVSIGDRSYEIATKSVLVIDVPIDSYKFEDQDGGLAKGQSCGIDLTDENRTEWVIFNSKYAQMQRSKREAAIRLAEKGYRLTYAQYHPWEAPWVVSRMNAPAQASDGVELIDSSTVITGVYEVLGNLCIQDITTAKDNAPLSISHNLGSIKVKDHSEIALNASRRLGATHVIGFTKSVSLGLSYCLIVRKTGESDKLVIQSACPVLVRIKEPADPTGGFAANTAFYRATALSLLQRGYYPLFPDTEAKCALPRDPIGFVGGAALKWEIEQIGSGTQANATCALVDEGEKLLFEGRDSASKDALSVIYWRVSDVKAIALLRALGRMPMSGNYYPLAKSDWKAVVGEKLPEYLISTTPWQKISIPAEMKREEIVGAVRRAFYGHWRCHVADGDENLFIGEYKQGGWVTTVYMRLGKDSIEVFRQETLKGLPNDKDGWAKKVCVRLQRDLEAFSSKR